MSSQVVTWGLSLLAVVFVPRYLGAGAIGRLHLAGSIWAMGLVITAFGMNLSVVKAVARDHSQIGPLLASSIAARLILCIPVTLVLFGYAFAVGYSSEILTLMVFVGVLTVAQTLIGSVSSILKGLERVGAMALAGITGRVVAVFGAVALLLMGYGVYAVAAVSVVGAALTLVLQLRALRKVRSQMGDTSPTVFDLSSIRELLKESLPYLWMSLFISLYLQVDTIIISLVVENDDVLGWYSVYDRLGGTLMFVPTVFMTAVYPTLSRLYETKEDSGPEDYNALTQKAFQVLLLISVPVGVGLSLLARPLVELLFGQEFSNAGPVLVVGGFVTSLTYLTTVLGMFLISMDRQRQWSRFIALGAILTIPLDFVLVPFFQSRYDNGAIGGAVAYLITETIILSGAIYLLPRGALGVGSVSYVSRVIGAGLLMAAAVYPVRELNLIVPIAVGVVGYGVAVAGLRLTSPEDRALLIGVLPGRLTKRMRSER